MDNKFNQIINSDRQKKLDTQPNQALFDEIEVLNEEMEGLLQFASSDNPEAENMIENDTIKFEK